MVDGNFKGIAFRNVIQDDKYPTISFHSPNEEVKVNFGKDPFKYDIENMIIVTLYNELIGKESKQNKRHLQRTYITQ
jgi:hypothetical protein